MNERLRELAEQAGAVFVNSNGVNDCPQDSLVGDEIQKFAELIVRQCVEICMKEFDTGLLMAPQAPWIARQIKKHFGVES
jgi:hypothetical protein